MPLRQQEATGKKLPDGAFCCRCRNLLQQKNTGEPQVRSLRTTCGSPVMEAGLPRTGLSSPRGLRAQSVELTSPTRANHFVDSPCFTSSLHTGPRVPLLCSGPTYSLAATGVVRRVPASITQAICQAVLQTCGHSITSAVQYRVQDAHRYQHQQRCGQREQDETQLERPAPLHGADEIIPRGRHDADNQHQQQDAPHTETGVPWLGNTVQVASVRWCRHVICCCVRLLPVMPNCSIPLIVAPMMVKAVLRISHDKHGHRRIALAWTGAIRS